MKLSKSKINVTIGSLTGLLIGFVLGITFGSSDSRLESSGSAAGNVSMISRHHVQPDQGSEASCQNDTLKYTVIDEEGETWKVTMTK